MESVMSATIIDLPSARLDREREAPLTVVDAVVGEVLKMPKHQQVAFLEAMTRKTERVANSRSEGCERNPRRDSWYKAECRLSFLNALRKLGQAAYVAFKNADYADAKPYADLDKGPDL